MHLSPIPPRDWLVHALLVYDKVQIDPDQLQLVLSSKDKFPSTIPQSEIDYFNKILASEELKPAFLSKSVVLDQTVFKEIIDSQGIDKLITIFFLDAIGNFRAASPEVYQVRSTVEKIIFASAINIPDLDLYFPWFSGGATSDTTSSILFTSIQQLVPLSPDKIEPSQIFDFRKANKLSRIEMLKASDAVIADIKCATTEADSTRLTKELTDHMQDRLQTMQKQYKQCNIKTTVKGLAPVSSGSLGTLGLLHSLTNLAICTTSATIGAVALLIGQSLIDDQSNRESLKTDKWAYYWNLDKASKSTWK